mgnify:CR=1 FL=1|jgi:hypothetical protein
MKNKINILVYQGCIQSVMSDSKDVTIDIIDLDSNPELEDDWDELTKNQHEV